jgi:hypothetical protein
MALKKASKDRQRLEEKIEDMSNNMDDKFSDMMNALDDLKGIYNRPAQCEVTTPRNASSFMPQLDMCSNLRSTALEKKRASQYTNDAGPGYMKLIVSSKNEK